MRTNNILQQCLDVAILLIPFFSIYQVLDEHLDDKEKEVVRPCYDYVIAHQGKKKGI